MSVITVQIGQCGNQLGCSLFETLAREAGADDAARRVFFRDTDDESSDAAFTAADVDTSPGGFGHSHHGHSRSGKKRWAARAVLVDMEPKAVDAAAARARGSAGAGAAGGSDWSYEGAGRLAGDSGSGNNWALGHHVYGPRARDAALDLVRREAEACDWLDGVLLLQSAAGGTGAGLGTCLAEALADELCGGGSGSGGGGGALVNACVWPYAAGDVAVQPYNALLTLAGLTAASDGVVLLPNDALHAACARSLGIARPTFDDLNRVASAALAGALLPAYERAPAGGSTSASPASSSSRPHLGLAQPLRPLGEICARVTCHPRHRVASLRHAPLLAPGAAEFSAPAWPQLLRRLRQAAVSGGLLADGAGAGPSWASTAPGDLPAHRYRNAAAASALFLRGEGALTVDASEFADARFHAPWAVDAAGPDDGGSGCSSSAPLLVAANPAPRPRGCGAAALSATLLAADQSAVAPARRTRDAGRRMLAARAFVHQYEAHGLEEAALLAAFAAVEDTLAAYDAL